MQVDRDFLRKCKKKLSLLQDFDDFKNKIKNFQIEFTKLLNLNKDLDLYFEINGKKICFKNNLYKEKNREFVKQSIINHKKELDNFLDKIVADIDEKVAEILEI